MEKIVVHGLRNIRFAVVDKNNHTVSLHLTDKDAGGVVNFSPRGDLRVVELLYTINCPQGSESSGKGHDNS